VADEARGAGASGAEAPRQRLFFALWPDEGVRDALVALTRGALRRGRAVAHENLHITLVFLGAVSPQGRDCAEAAAGGVVGAPFTLTLDRLGSFRRAQILWSAPSEVPSALYDLVGALNRGLMRCGFEPDARAYRAHVTLARKVRGRVPQTTHEPVAWHVDWFHLIESHTRSDGARYRVLRSWPLGQTN